MNRRLCLFLIIVLTAAFYFQPQPEAKAIDPVTIAILTPIAIKAAQIMAPYLIRALRHMGVTMVKAGVQLIGIFRLPIGLLQSTIFAPWCFMSGLANIGVGLISPIKFVGYVLLIPLSAFGIGV